MAALTPAISARRPRVARVLPSATILVRGLPTAYLSLVVLLPLAALLVKATGIGWNGLWQTLTIPSNLAALKLTVGVSIIVVVVNALFGTLIAWVLVRDTFPGKSIVNSLIDLPFALPTIVAGLTLLTLYGPSSPFHVNVAYTRVGIALALLFVTLPFVTRAVQPVLITLDRDMEEAAAVLGANNPTIFRKIVLPNLAPALLAGAGLAFARALGEFGSVTLIAGNNPLRGTQVMSLVVYGDIESYQFPAAATLSVVLLVLSLAVLLLFNRLSMAMSGHHDV